MRYGKRKYLRKEESIRKKWKKAKEKKKKGV